MESSPTTTKNLIESPQQSNLALHRSTSEGGAFQSSSFSQQAQSNPTAQLQQSQSSLIMQSQTTAAGTNLNNNTSSAFTNSTGFSRPMGGNTYGYNNGGMGYSNNYSSYGGGYGGMNTLGYGNSYGAYGGMNGGRNNMMMGPEGVPPQMNDTSFRHEYQGVLQGLNALLNIMYAGVGMVMYGKKFVKLFISAGKFVIKGCFRMLVRLFGITLIGKFIAWLKIGKGLQFLEVALERAWRDSNAPSTTTFKALITFRALLFIGEKLKLKIFWKFFYYN